MLDTPSPEPARHYESPSPCDTPAVAGSFTLRGAQLKGRQVKETTALLNLQSKPEFKRVAKATCTLAKIPAK